MAETTRASANIEERPRLDDIPPGGSRVLFDPAWCRTCRVCEAVCSIAREGTASPSLARINIQFDEFEPVHPISARICFQCADAPCVSSCPVEAMGRDDVTGVVCIDPELCIGCMKCAKACPWSVPKRHPDRKLAIKCDVCSDRAEGPICVAMCPLSGKALRYEDNGRGADVASVLARPQR